jgi:transcriptional regulator with XRE-family HTH domain
MDDKAPVKQKKVMAKMQNSLSVNPVDVVIGAAVRQQRALREKTVAQTADALSVSEKLYSLCESGHVAFQAGDLFTLADFFGVRARDLMPSKEELAYVEPTQRYGEPEEVRDLIYYFSGVVSPSLRGFFLQQIEDASIQGERVMSLMQTAAPRKPLLSFGFQRGSAAS